MRACARRRKLYRIIRSMVARSAPADADVARGWRSYAHFAQDPSVRLNRRFAAAIRIRSIAAPGSSAIPTVVLMDSYSHQNFQTPLRRIRPKDLDTGKTLVSLTQ
jgi:hypothetical protein